MQLQGELKQTGRYVVHYRNVFHAAYAIAHADGILALQKGLAPALGYQFIMNGVRLGTFHIIENSGIMRTNGDLDPLKYVCGGAFAGALGSYFGSPIYLVSISHPELLTSLHKCIFHHSISCMAPQLKIKKQWVLFMKQVMS